MKEKKKGRKEERKTGKRRERKKEIREEWGNILLFLFYFEKHCIFITMLIKLMQELDKTNLKCASCTEWHT